MLGLIWIADRVLYLTGYSQAAAKRAGVLQFGRLRHPALGRRLGAIVWQLVQACGGMSTIRLGRQRRCARN